MHAGQFGSKQRGSLKHTDNEQPARRPAGHTAKPPSGQPARRPSSQLVCLSASQPANQPARIHRGTSSLLLSAPSLSQPQQANRSDASLSLSLSLSLSVCGCAFIISHVCPGLLWSMTTDGVESAEKQARLLS